MIFLKRYMDKAVRDMTLLKVTPGTALPQLRHAACQSLGIGHLELRCWFAEYLVRVAICRRASSKLRFLAWPKLLQGIPHNGVTKESCLPDAAGHGESEGALQFLELIACVRRWRLIVCRDATMKS
jgi:hypothetical protein